MQVGDHDIKIVNFADCTAFFLKSDSHLPKNFLFILFNESPLKMMKNAFISS